MSEHEWDASALKRLLEEGDDDKLMELTGMTPAEAARLLGENDPGEEEDEPEGFEVGEAAEEPPNEEIAELTRLVAEHDWEALDQKLGITPDAIDEILNEKPWVELAEASGPIGPALEDETEDAEDDEPEEKRA